MNPSIALVVGCLGLGLLIAYAVWSSVRGAILQADLWEVVAELDAAMRAKGESSNFGYLANRKFMVGIIRFAPHLSLPVAFLASRLNAQTNRSGKSAMKLPPSVPQIDWSGSIPQEVAVAYTKLLARIFVHWMLSPADAAIIIALLMSHRTGGLVSRLTTLWQESGALAPLPRTGAPHNA